MSYGISQSCHFHLKTIHSTKSAPMKSWNTPVNKVIGASFRAFQDCGESYVPMGCSSVPVRRYNLAIPEPGHSRVISPQSFYFLDKSHYAQIGQTSMTDYRHVYRGDFKLVHSQNQGDVFAYTVSHQTVAHQRWASWLSSSFYSPD